jgi:hypothetical protein
MMLSAAEAQKYKNTKCGNTSASLRQNKEIATKTQKTNTILPFSQKIRRIALSTRTMCLIIFQLQPVKSAGV